MYFCIFNFNHWILYNDYLKKNKTFSSKSLLKKLSVIVLKYEMNSPLHYTLNSIKKNKSIIILPSFIS